MPAASKVTLAMVCLAAILAFAGGCGPTERQAGPQGPVGLQDTGETQEPIGPQVIPPELVDRESKIPPDVPKMTPDKDQFPPQLHSDEYEEPVPVAYPISTAGAEDSPFIMPDGKTLYFFFTPDVRVPVEKQIIDHVTGIYMAERENGTWGDPERVILNDDLSLDGCVFVQDDIMWFCSARAGYTGVHWFTAELIDGRWQNWQYASDEFPESYEVGELHISRDGTETYYHSSRSGGKGSYDIWVTRKVGGKWQEPENIAVVNSTESDGWPFLTQDGSELWFTRFYLGSPAVFRSQKTDGEWGESGLIVSQFAGEPTLDDAGNLYFVHHYFSQGQMIEADIYLAEKK